MLAIASWLVNQKTARLRPCKDGIQAYLLLRHIQRCANSQANGEEERQG